MGFVVAVLAQLYLKMMVVVELLDLDGQLEACESRPLPSDGSCTTALGIRVI